MLRGPIVYRVILYTGPFIYFRPFKTMGLGLSPPLLDSSKMYVISSPIVWARGQATSDTEVVFTLLYCTLLYSTVLYCTLVYSTVFYCIILYCTILYCTVVLCTHLSSIVLCAVLTVHSDQCREHCLLHSAHVVPYNAHVVPYNAHVVPYNVICSVYCGAHT